MCSMLLCGKEAVAMNRELESDSLLSPSLCYGGTKMQQGAIAIANADLVITFHSTHASCM
jgi:hypothetical protein